MAGSSEGPETFYGDHSLEEIREFHNRHTKKVERPHKPGLLANLLKGRGRQTDLSIEYDVEGMKRATRTPLVFRHEGPPEPALPEGKFVTDRKGRMRKVGE